MEMPMVVKVEDTKTGFTVLLPMDNWWLRCSMRDFPHLKHTIVSDSHKKE